MATAIQPNEVEIFRKTIVALGEVTLSRREANEYEAEFWEGFAYWLGKKIIEGNKEKILPSKDCGLSFFPVGENNLVNLMRKQNKSFLGESIVSPLFHIEYDKNLQIKDCFKKEEKIPTKMRFIIFC